MGFRPPGRWDSVLPLSECHLLDSTIEAVRATVEELAARERAPRLGPSPGDRLRPPSARALRPDGSGGGGQPGDRCPRSCPTPQDSSNGCAPPTPRWSGVVHAVNGGRAEISSGLDSRTLWGRPYLLEQVAGMTLKVSIDAFFQTNTLMAHVLYGLVAREAGARCVGAAAARSPAASLAGDCARSSGTSTRGSGPSACRWPAGPRRCWGSRLCRPPSPTPRRTPASTTSTTPASSRETWPRCCARWRTASRRLPEGLESPDVIIVDPPRAGLSKKAISRIGEVGAPRIVYVSCNPSTMAPNIAQFREYGYRLERVTPVDMFPHTPHVEAVGLLVRRGCSV